MNASEINITVQANVLLTKEGIDIRVTKQPFGDANKDLLSQILRRKLIDKKGLKHHFKEYMESVAGVRDIKTIQSHRLPNNAKLFSPLDISGVLYEHLISEPKWVIVDNLNSFKKITNNAKKPEITICLNDDNESFEITPDRNNSYTIIPASIELVIPGIMNIISSGSIYSEKKISEINFIEADNFKIPLFVVQSNEKPENGIDLLNDLMQKIDDKTSNIKLKIAGFYLDPTECFFNEVIDNISTENIVNHDSAKRGLQEIIDLKNRMQSFNFTNESTALAYNKILNNLTWDDLMDHDVDIMIHCRTLYSNKINQLVDSFSVETEKESWGNIHNNIEKIGKIYHDLHLLQSKISKSGYKSQYNVISKVIEESYQKCKHSVEKQIDVLPNPSTTNEIRDLFGLIKKAYNDDGINARYIKHIKSLINIETTIIDPGSLLDIQLYFSQHRYPPEDDELVRIYHRIFGKIEIDLLKQNNVQKFIQIYNGFRNIKQDFFMKNPVGDYLPNKIEKSENKGQIQNLINNLAELNKNQVINNQYLQKMVGDQSNHLVKSEKFEDLQLWLFLLSSVKRSVESPQKTKVFEISGDEIWNIIYPHIEKEPHTINKIKKDLDALGLSDKVTKFEKEVGKGTDNSLGTNKKVADENTSKKRKLNKKPPISRIVVDGSNVARAGLKDGQGSAEQLIIVYNSLKKDYGFDGIVILIGAGLRHHTPDFEKLKQYIDNDVVREAPAGTSDDFYIIQFALDNDMLILTNDMYRDFKEKHLELKGQIDMRRVTFMINPDGSLSLGEFPNYKKEE